MTGLLTEIAARKRRTWALKVAHGDALHAVLCGAGHNIGLLLKKLRLLCAQILASLQDWLMASAAAPVNQTPPVV
jgi:IS5 family transposase